MQTFGKTYDKIAGLNRLHYGIVSCRNAGDLFVYMELEKAFFTSPAQCELLLNRSNNFEITTSLNDFLLAKYSNQHNDSWAYSEFSVCSQKVTDRLDIVEFEDTLVCSHPKTILNYKVTESIQGSFEEIIFWLYENKATLSELRDAKLLKRSFVRNTCVKLKTIRFVDAIQ